MTKSKKEEKKPIEETEKPSGTLGTMTEAEKEDVYARIRAWLQSPEGKAKLAEIAEANKKMREKLAECSKVDPELLRKPMTI